MIRRPVVGHADFRRRAARRLPPMVFDFIDGGADEEFTVRENRRAFDDLAFVARVLAGVGERNQEVEILGRKLSLPVMLAPTGLARVAGRGGEIAAARAAAAHGTLSITANGTSIPLEQVAASVEEPGWFQVYLFRDRAITLRLIEAAKRAGFTALVVTADGPVPSNRERDRRHGLSLPVRPRPRAVAGVISRPRWMLDLFTSPPLTTASIVEFSQSDGDLAAAAASMFNDAQAWDEIEWIRKAWDGPLVVKAIMCREDAEIAADVGADGIVVSNHGGRQCDSLPATIDVLPEIVDAVGSRVDVLMDSGVRRGTDVVKALALGAKACLVGRPWLYGLASGGEQGIGAMLDGFQLEIDKTLALIGRRSAAELDPSILMRRPGSGWQRLVDGAPVSAATGVREG
jgi:isopentenyl diphosphate isomerase/L-lactate dehydrogenase-like FMN-dependent dehydrogenase